MHMSVKTVAREIAKWKMGKMTFTKTIYYSLSIHKNITNARLWFDNFLRKTNSTSQAVMLSVELSLPALAG